MISGPECKSPIKEEVAGMSFELISLYMEECSKLCPLVSLGIQ